MAEQRIVFKIISEKESVIGHSFITLFILLAMIYCIFIRYDNRKEDARISYLQSVICCYDFLAILKPESAEITQIKINNAKKEIESIKNSDNYSRNFFMSGLVIRTFPIFILIPLVLIIDSIIQILKWKKRIRQCQSCGFC
jgi:hypothetical protein